MEHSIVVNPPSSGQRAISSPDLPDSEVSKRRCYVCSFCGREFRNAQALGGHMNVHRRERVLANQLLELRNLKGNHGTNLKVGAAAAASNNPPKSGEEQVDVMTHACDMHGGELCAAGSSSSSSSPPSQQASTSTFASSLVQPWRDPLLRLQLPCEKPRLARRDSSVDLELRLGLTSKE